MAGAPELSEPKRELSRNVLEKYGVSFDESVYIKEPGPTSTRSYSKSTETRAHSSGLYDTLSKIILPGHVEAVRKRLLDFDRIVPLEASVNGLLLSCRF